VKLPALILGWRSYESTCRRGTRRRESRVCAQPTYEDLGPYKGRFSAPSLTACTDAESWRFLQRGQEVPAGGMVDVERHSGLAICIRSAFVGSPGWCWSSRPAVRSRSAWTRCDRSVSCAECSQSDESATGRAEARGLRFLVPMLGFASTQHDYAVVLGCTVTRAVVESYGETRYERNEGRPGQPSRSTSCRGVRMSIASCWRSIASRSSSPVMSASA
jgi:hypothetical protein